MLGSTNFWFGVAFGVGGVWLYNRYTSRKSSSAS